jgi:hypothetical protein
MVDLLNVKVWRPGWNLNRTSSASLEPLEPFLSDVFIDESWNEYLVGTVPEFLTQRYKKVLLKNKDRRLEIRFYG